MTFKDGYILKDDKAQTVSPRFIMKFANKSIRLMILLIVVAFQCSSAWAVPDEIEESLKYAQGLSRAFSYVSEKIRPSIVTISSVKHARQSSFQAPPQQFQNGQLRDFFGEDFFERFFQGPPRQGQAEQGMGSGVIVDPSGYILTNNHVVGFADEIDVRLWDRREFRAELIGTDEKTDLAVIKIKANDLVAATLGDSDNLHIGEWVVAAGNPFGLDNSITQGIVSATGRSNVGIVDYEDFIQTDAAINPGNSGGPLVNLKGEVIGINSAIFSRSGGYMGIGFAIPVNMARTVMKSLIKDGRVVRGWLGVAIQDLDKDMAASFGFKGTEGALIGDLTPDGPADRAGIKQGDIVVRYDGQVVTNVTQLRNLVAATKPGERVDLIVFRDGTEKSLRVKIGELKAEQRGIDAQEEPSLEIGVAIQAITPEIAQQLGVSSDEGVVVSGVEPGSVAESAGLRVRDVILKINGKSVNSVQEFRDLMKKSDLAKGVRLTVQSGDFQRYVFLKTRG